MVMWYGPYLNGRYGNGSVLCTSQSRSGAALGRLKSTGVHTPGGRSGALSVLVFLEAGFSRSGEVARRIAGFVRLMTRVTSMYVKNAASKPP